MGGIILKQADLKIVTTGWCPVIKNIECVISAIDLWTITAQPDEYKINLSQIDQAISNDYYHFMFSTTLIETTNLLK